MLKIPASYDALLKSVKAALIEGQKRIEAERVRTYWEAGRLIHGHVLQIKELPGPSPSGTKARRNPNSN